MCLGLALLALGSSSAQAETLPRVMSLNVCTDQLVLALADREQIISLSELSDDRALSFYHQQAGAFPKNKGLAEEVFLARPDMVVTGTYSLHNTTELLKRIGVRVEEFAYTQTLETIADDIRRMGKLLGHEERGQIMAEAFETELMKLAVAPDALRPSAIAYDQNGIVAGAGTMTDSALRLAGWSNLAADQGAVGVVPFPLETLIFDRPDAVLVSPPYDKNAPSLADQAGLHPALMALGPVRQIDPTPQGSLSCGGPFTLDAVKALRALRDRMIAAKQSEMAGRTQ